MRVETTNQIRGILKNFGVALEKGSGKPFNAYKSRKNKLLHKIPIGS